MTDHRFHSFVSIYLDQLKIFAIDRLRSRQAFVTHNDPSLEIAMRPDSAHNPSLQAAVLTEEPELDPLLMLDSVVRSDTLPSGLRGRLVVGIFNDERTRWWSASFGRTVETCISEQPASTPAPDAILCMDEQAASRILGSPRSSDQISDQMGEVAFEGDRAFVRKFMARYLERLSPLTARSNAILSNSAWHNREKTGGRRKAKTS